MEIISKKPRLIYGDQLLCLLVLLGMAAVKSGTRSLGLAFVAVLTCIVADMLCCYLTRKVYNPRDLSTIITGLCLTLMSPASLPYPLIIFGSALALGVKHIFGGKDNYIFNPTAVAFAFLIICYPGRMLLFPIVGETLPLFGGEALSSIAQTTGIENLLLRIGAFPPLTALEFLTGNFAGPLGTTHVLVIIVCALCLLLRGSVSPVVTVACLSVIVISRLLFPIYEDILGGLFRELAGGYLLFALFFLAGDPQTLPKTVFGKLYYGVLLGVLTVVFRGASEGVFRGRVEGWFIFALLIANALSYRLDLTSERVSIAAATFSRNFKKRLSAYERFSEGAKSGTEFRGSLSDTQEIDLGLSNYDMPSVDNKVIKINRKKRNVLTYTIELAGSLREKVKRRKKIPAYINDCRNSFVVLAFKALFDSIKELFPKKQPAADNAQLTIDDVQSLDEDEAKTGVVITDFDEIADTIATIEEAHVGQTESTDVEHDAGDFASAQTEEQPPELNDEELTVDDVLNVLVDSRNIDDFEEAEEQL